MKSLVVSTMLFGLAAVLPAAYAAPSPAPGQGVEPGVSEQGAADQRMPTPDLAYKADQRLPSGSGGLKSMGAGPDRTVRPVQPAYDYGLAGGGE